MKFSQDILKSLNESEESIESIIDILIQDEQEAIDGYNDALSTLSNMNLDDSKMNNVTYYISHIIEEEKEHIEELNKLRASI